jgi:hypothetical protein
VCLGGDTEAQLHRLGTIKKPSKDGFLICPPGLLFLDLLVDLPLTGGGIVLLELDLTFHLLLILAREVDVVRLGGLELY